MQLAMVSPSVQIVSPQSEAQSPPLARLQESAFSKGLQQPSPQTSSQGSDGQLQRVSPGSHSFMLSGPSLHCGSLSGAWHRYVGPNTWHVPTGQAQSMSLLQFIQPGEGGETKKQQPSVLLGSGSQSAGQLQAVSPGPSHVLSPSHNCAPAREGNIRTNAIPHAKSPRDRMDAGSAAWFIAPRIARGRSAGARGLVRAYS